jgi:hypothetical protein
LLALAVLPLTALAQADDKPCPPRVYPLESAKAEEKGTTRGVPVQVALTGTFPAARAQEDSMRKAICLSVVCLCATPALAADPIGSAAPVPSGAQLFQQLDANRDGFLSFTETFPNARAANSFNLLDTNADGQLSPVEFTVIYR